MLYLAYVLWALSFIGGLVAFLINTSFAPWFVAFVCCLGLVRIEKVIVMLNKFHVLDDEDDDG